jgi:vacuolar-type H+-ATPase subunit I/STV1
MPKTDLTPELRRDLQLLKMRNVLDPKRHYKKDNAKNDVPAFSQVGTIIEGPTEFFSSRLSNKDRKQTLLEEVVHQEESSGRFKRKYNDISKVKASGGKNFYKKQQAKRNKGKVTKP